MKTVAIASSLLTVVLGLSVLQSCGGTKTETVSAETIAKLPPGKTFEIDLTKKGTVYKFDDAGTDFSRVTVRTAAGDKSFADLLRESNTSLRGGLRLGTPNDMRDHLPPSGGFTSKYDCGVICKCDGTTDCIDLILSGKCGDAMWCSDEISSCYCTAKP